VDAAEPNSFSPRISATGGLESHGAPFHGHGLVLRRCEREGQHVAQPFLLFQNIGLSAAGLGTTVGFFHCATWVHCAMPATTLARAY
jgi:hypothetical protein